jgi:hypothetical protein
MEQMEGEIQGALESGIRRAIANQFNRIEYHLSELLRKLDQGSEASEQSVTKGNDSTIVQIGRKLMGSLGKHVPAVRKKMLNSLVDKAVVEIVSDLEHDFRVAISKAIPTIDDGLRTDVSRASLPLVEYYNGILRNVEDEIRPHEGFLNAASRY